jgi:hypothetical protein
MIGNLFYKKRGFLIILSNIIIRYNLTRRLGKTLDKVVLKARSGRDER